MKNEIHLTTLNGWAGRGLFTPHPFLSPSKICHTYSAMKKRGTIISDLKEDPKHLWSTWCTPFVLLTSELLYRKSANFALWRNIDIDCILKQISNPFNFSWVFKDVKILINMATILMMSAKMATPGLLKIEVLK